MINTCNICQLKHNSLLHFENNNEDAHIDRNVKNVIESQSLPSSTNQEPPQEKVGYVVSSHCGTSVRNFPFCLLPKL